ncbi:hypothetical protein CR513_29371, partial [Mucuna pruriens]
MSPQDSARPFVWLSNHLGAFPQKQCYLSFLISLNSLSFVRYFLDAMTKAMFRYVHALVFESSFSFVLVWSATVSPFETHSQPGSDTDPCFFYPQGTSPRMHLAPPLKETTLGNEQAGSSSDSYDSYPFEIWYRDDTQDSMNEDPQAWVDYEVKKISSVLTRSSTLLGMAKAICQRGPWSVSVSPCRHGEAVCTTSPAGGKPYFYLYDSLHSKLGVKLPFTHFERAVLQALNVAPTQLHPNSRTFVRAFELLCEDLGKAPTLGVFFWFFTVKKTDKVGWTSLGSRPKRKLFKPFLESYKSFKTRFFKVAPNDSGPNLLLDRAGRPFFPLCWTHQPAVSVTVRLFSHALRDLKKRAAHMAEEEHHSAASAEPLAAAEPSPQRGVSEGTSNTPSLVVLNQPAHASSPIVQEADENSLKESEERPNKRPHIEEPNFVEPAEVDRPSGPTSLLGQAVDKGLASSSENHKVKQLGVVGTCNALQQYAAYSLVLARAAEKEFDRLESQSKSCAKRAEKAEAKLLNLSKAFSKAEVKINTFRSANAALEEDLQRTIVKNKDLARAIFEMEMSRDSAYAEMNDLRQKNKDLEASNLCLSEKLASTESLLKQALEDVQARDQTIYPESSDQD